MVGTFQLLLVIEILFFLILDKHTTCSQDDSSEKLISNKEYEERVKNLQERIFDLETTNKVLRGRITDLKKRQVEILEPGVKNVMACDASILNIGCEPEYVISVLRADYGRKSKEKFTVNGGAPMHTEYCFAINSKSIVDNYCSGKQNCSIAASHTIFGDPCGGTYKYLELDYKCISKPQIKNAIACEASILDIGCEPEYVISVLRANYGRKSKETCNLNGGPPMHTEYCFAASSKTIVDNYCSGKQICSMQASHTIFGDPCGGTYKYLEVDYQCIPLETLEPGVKNTIACDASILYIECEPEYVISVLRANYGRKSKKTCNLNGGAPMLTEYCFAINSKTIVDNYCSGKQNCSIQASHTIFGDPCGGTYKYLEVDYKCISKPQIKNAIACEASILEIGCEPEYVISVLRANYGRKSRETCNLNGGAPMLTEYCFAASSKTIVDNYCSGKQICSMQASHTIFGDPCDGTYKYLEVDYQCIPRYVPLETDQNEDYTDSKNVTEGGKMYLKCRAKLGTKAYILEIENPSEWNFLETQLAPSDGCPGCTRNFWNNGKSGKHFVLTASDTVQMEIAPVTDDFKYICEEPTTAPPTRRPTYTPNTQPQPPNPNPVEVCYNDNDLIVLLDSSHSIGSSNYKIEKVFAYDLARSFVGVARSRFGLTIFASAVLKVVPLTNTFTPTELSTKILNADFMDSTTYTNLAINTAIAEFNASPRSVPQNLVVITDGVSNNKVATQNSIDAAIESGIRTFSIGIGSATNNVEFLAIAGGDSNRMFTASNFDKLTALINPLSRAICQ